MIAVGGRPLSASEVHDATGLPRPTCYRLLQTLHAARLLDDPGDAAKYVIGERLIRIALLGKSDIDVRRATAPILKTAAVSFGDTVFLSRFRGHQVEIIHVETPSDPARAYMHPGLGVRPMHACSCSKAIAAFTEQSFQEDILNGSLKQYTEHTKITQEALRAEFARIREQGYAECDQEIEIGMVSVAAPIQIGNVGATFSVGALGSVRRFSDSYRKKVGEELKRVAVKVSAAIQLCNAAEI